MKGKGFTTAYALCCTLLMLAGFFVVFFLAWQRELVQMLAGICGLVLGLIAAPIVHELGHLVVGKTQKFECVYWKAFCLQWTKKGGKLRFAFASPLRADQTQMLPKSGGNMRLRAGRYVRGGLLFGALLVGVLLLVGICTGSFFVWGMLPYAAYLFMLNALPVEYASGKTDALVYSGIKWGEDAERCMLAAMEIQGQVYEGKSFGEIEEGLYFDLPVLREDEPLFALLCDLRYRYCLDKEDFDGAGEWLNRLASIEEYLLDEEREKLSAELVYMHALQGNREGADGCGKLCEGYLASEALTPKRILAAYCQAFGKTDAVAPLQEQANSLMATEPMGVQKFENRLLNRIKA